MEVNELTESDKDDADSSSVNERVDTSTSQSSVLFAAILVCLGSFRIPGIAETIFARGERLCFN